MSDAKLEFTQGDAQWTKLRQKALDDLYFFAGTIMGYADLIPMRPLVHRPMTAFLGRTTGVQEIDEANVQLLLMPREAGKSALTRCRIVQRLCKYPNRSILLCSETSTLAEAILSSIKQEMLTNTLLRALFPEVIPADDKASTLWRRDQLNVLRSTNRPDPSLMIAGVDRAITGFHPDDIIVDDMIGREAAENARVGDRSISEALKGWMRTLVPIVNKQADPHWTMTFIGTRWFNADPYDYVVDYWGRNEDPRRFVMWVPLPTGDRQKVVIQKQGDLAILRRAAVENGHTIFPDKWTDEKLAQMRVADPSGFACWYMNEPTDAITQVFKDDWVKSFQWVDLHHVKCMDETGKMATYDIHRDLDVLISCDPGGFKREMKGTGRARPAIVVTGTTPHDQHLVLDCWSEDRTYDEAAEHIIRLAQRYNPRKVVVEWAGQQVMFIDLVKRLAKEARLNLAFEEYKPDTREKAQRILSLEPYFQHGQILLSSGPNMVDIRTQIQQFPSGARVDLLDALHMLARFWRRAAVPKTQADRAVRRQNALRSYYERRGLPMP